VSLLFDAVLNELAVSRARMCIGSWFQASDSGPATANARVPKCVTERDHKVATRCLSYVLICIDGF